MHRSSSPPPLSKDSALFLDIDGTLLDFSMRPTDVTVPPDLPLLLREIGIGLGGALALLSGRVLEEIEAMLGSGLMLAAEHGAMLRNADGGVIAALNTDPVPEEIAPALRAAVAARPGTLLEEKRFGLALHWRAAPAMAGELTALAEELAAPYPNLLLLPAHAALEIRARGTDKGEALATFMAMQPFAGRRPVFIGDDVTDEPAIARAEELGGRGLHVERDFGGTPEAVRTWLADSLKGWKTHAATA